MIVATFLFVTVLATSAGAQSMDERRCFTIFNSAPYGIFGSLVTDYYDTDEGGRARHNSNFRLQPSERGEFCSYGPFYGENKDQLNLVIRSFVPLFSCYFVADGEVVIYGRHKAEGGTQTWASCETILYDHRGAHPQ